MNRKSIRWAGWLCVSLLAAASGLWRTHAQQQPNPNFQGKVTRIEENSQGAIAHFRFEAGSRTKWHSHDGGQIILVEEGVGLTQVRGGPVIELHAGETIYCPPGVEHWHGAAPNQAGVQFNISRGGIKWLEEVSEKEYTAPAKRLMTAR
ncbi:MAG TPA: cupin domain-containing protein [Bryobacteraceae bacterium]|nr:cupin domain-containing protein [Bryobacteraceae bacterium]